LIYLCLPSPASRWKEKPYGGRYSRLKRPPTRGISNYDSTSTSRRPPTRFYNPSIHPTQRLSSGFPQRMHDSAHISKTNQLPYLPSGSVTTVGYPSRFTYSRNFFFIQTRPDLGVYRALLTSSPTSSLIVNYIPFTCTQQQHPEEKNTSKQQAQAKWS